MKKKLEKPILAEGEATGHHHALSGAVDVYQIDEDVKEFDLHENMDLTHQEHGTIALPKGKFESGQALEYDPFAEEAREVVD